MHFKKFIILLSIFSLVSCATGRYDKANILKIEDSTYRISFGAMNDSTSKLEKYILVKGAELCLKEGYNYFSLHRQINKKTMTENFGYVMRSEAEVKLYKLKPNSTAGIYNCLNVMKNIGTTIGVKDLSSKYEKKKDKKNKEDNKKPGTNL